MQALEHNQFELLKQKIVEVMMRSYPGINPSIAEWKGQEITDFQEDLRIRVNANISEKWFYTHMKSSRSTLPRIDMLNLLSKYAGYANWDDFLFRNRQTDHTLQPAERRSLFRPDRYFILVPLLVLIIALFFFGVFKLFNTREYRFTFIDADTHDTITSPETEIILLSNQESPVRQMAGSDGSFRLRTDKSKITMVVKAHYYHTDTIIRMVRKLNREETVEMRPDDYALMIHYFSTMKVDDWEKRRQRLDSMIDDGAMICQVPGGQGQQGMAIYNKDEFIDRLTMPSGSLKNIEIVDSKTREGKIVVLRYRINEKTE